MSVNQFDGLPPVIDEGTSDFRKYLTQQGVMQKLTKVLVSLYEEPERPENPLEYVKRHLGVPAGIDIEDIRAENEELKRRNEELQATVDSLMSQLEDLKQEMEM
jgi:hypothetical protein